MDEYIKREAVIDLITRRYENPEICTQEINSIPAADVAPVVHGRWEYIPQTLNTLSQLRCPFCGWWSLDPSIDGTYNYCPNCGAKMDGGDTDAAD
nr:MAG TPA: TFIIB zinc-binding [Caudoviricetes sp.]